MRPQQDKYYGQMPFSDPVYAVWDQKVELRMTARFLPRGLGGLLYWYALYPVHLLIFKGMLRAIARQVRAPILDGPRRFDTRGGPWADGETIAKT